MFNYELYLLRDNYDIMLKYDITVAQVEKIINVSELTH